VNTTLVELAFTDAAGCRRTVQAVSNDGQDWHLHASLDGRAFDHHCRNWQHVERTVQWLSIHEGKVASATVTATPVRGLVAGLLAAVSIVVAAASSAQPLRMESDGILQFTRAAEEYTFMHRRLERRLPVLEVSADTATIRRAIDAMAAAIRAERSDARQGDLFNPAAETTIRVRVANALRSHGLTPLDVRVAERAQGADAGAAVLRVNGTFPWALGTAMFSCVLEALPPIPPELQYRLVGRDLVLIDVHASLIVDVLPLALGESDPPSWPAATVTGGA